MRAKGAKVKRWWTFPVYSINIIQDRKFGFLCDLFSTWNFVICTVYRMMVPQSIGLATVASPSPAVSPAYIQTYVGSIQQSKTLKLTDVYNLKKKNLRFKFKPHLNICQIAGKLSSEFLNKWKPLWSEMLHATIKRKTKNIAKIIAERIKFWPEKQSWLSVLKFYG